ncbi:MAG: hypothetical protein Q8R18_04375 [bacterium]|nr:hypothetical protein [bacterium]
MRIAVSKERYPLEKRVAVMPDAIQKLVEEGHDVFVEMGAGEGVHISDEQYVKSGAQIMSDARRMYENIDMIVKLKAPSTEEFTLMNKKILICMMHSEQNHERIYYAGLQNLIIVELENIRDEKNHRIINQTGITGEIGVYYALRHSQKMPWDMKALVLGYGNVSTGALKACHRLGIETKILRKSEFKYIEHHLEDLDLLINGISWPDSARVRREYIVTKKHLKKASPHLIILDLSVDFPNPIETIRPTTYSQPYYLEEGRVHISLYGYPGLVPITSTKIYSQQIYPVLSMIAQNNGLRSIGNCGDLGMAIKKAILDPQKEDWEKYKPQDVLNGSKIE